MKTNIVGLSVFVAVFMAIAISLTFHELFSEKRVESSKVEKKIQISDTESRKVIKIEDEELEKVLECIRPASSDSIAILSEEECLPYQFPYDHPVLCFAVSLEQGKQLLSKITHSNLSKIKKFVLCAYTHNNDGIGFISLDLVCFNEDGYKKHHVGNCDPYFTPLEFRPTIEDSKWLAKLVQDNLKDIPDIDDK